MSRTSDDLVKYGLVGGIIYLLWKLLGNIGIGFGAGGGSGGRSGRKVLWIREDGLYEGTTHLSDKKPDFAAWVGNAAEIEVHATGSANHGAVENIIAYIKELGAVVIDATTTR